MNKTPFLGIPKLSRIVIHRARSLFDLERLLSPKPEVVPQRILVRPKPITRWNE
jgi:hypothetical protein